MPLIKIGGVDLALGYGETEPAAKFAVGLSSCEEAKTGRSLWQINSRLAINADNGATRCTLEPTPGACGYPDAPESACLTELTQSETSGYSA